MGGRGERVEDGRVERDDRAAGEEVPPHPRVGVDEVRCGLVQQRVHEEATARLQPRRDGRQQLLDVLRVLDGLDCDRGVEGKAAGGRHLGDGRVDKEGVVLDVHAHVGQPALRGRLGHVLDLLRRVGKGDKVQLWEARRVRQRERAPAAATLEDARAGRQRGEAKPLLVRCECERLCVRERCRAARRVARARSAVDGPLTSRVLEPRPEVRDKEGGVVGVELLVGHLHLRRDGRTSALLAVEFDLPDDHVAGAHPPADEEVEVPADKHSDDGRGEVWLQVRDEELRGLHGRAK
mmetsp:Transcript_35755/g.114957  ORF Transcript_35755/g.114957 Transcript_35755/m.114957 type:complete len:293 (+) Transcript_35755:207-1085(+)